MVSLVFDVGPGFWMVNKAATATTVVVVQGTDNVVPTGCRMPEVAAEKLM